MKLIEPMDLHHATRKIFNALGMRPDYSEEIAAHLVDADLRGVKSHGTKMAPKYADWITNGTISCNQLLSAVSSSPATLVMDANRLLGVAIGRSAMNQAVYKAKNVGLGWIVVKNSGHLGRVGAFAELAAEQDCIGIVGTSGGPFMVPTGGREARLGTNPIAIAAPAGQKSMFSYDAATTVWPVNKLKARTRHGPPVPPGIFLEHDGADIVEPRIPMGEDFKRLMPMGGHKGYGLAASVEILSSLLAGTMFGLERGNGKFCHFFAALDIRAFTNPRSFKADMDNFLQALNDTARAEPYKSVVYAGQREQEKKREALVKGYTSVNGDTSKWYDVMAEKHNIEVRWI